jgi:hypothetical protein
MPSAAPTGCQGLSCLRKAFITSQAYTGDLVTEANTLLGTNFSSIPADGDGVLAADAICQYHADSAGLSGEYIAWVSIEGSNAIDRLGNQKTSGYALTDGTVIADSRSDLLDGALDAFLVIDENGATVDDCMSPYVWTHTDISGQNPSAFGDRDSCDRFTSSSFSDKGMHGKFQYSDSRWTHSGAAECNDTFYLYCFEKQ